MNGLQIIIFILWGIVNLQFGRRLEIIETNKRIKEYREMIAQQEQKQAEEKTKNM